MLSRFINMHININREITFCKSYCGRGVWRLPCTALSVYFGKEEIHWAGTRDKFVLRFFISRMKKLKKFKRNGQGRMGSLLVTAIRLLSFSSQSIVKRSPESRREGDTSEKMDLSGGRNDFHFKQERCHQWVEMWECLQISWLRAETFLQII